MTASLAAARAADADHVAARVGTVRAAAAAAHLPIARRADVPASTPDAVELEAGRFATERTHVTFEGTTAWGERVAHSSFT